MKNRYKIFLLLSFLGITNLIIPVNSTAQVTVKGSSHMFVGYGLPNFLARDLHYLYLNSGDASGPYIFSYQYAIKDRITFGVQIGYESGSSTNIPWQDATTHEQFTYWYSGTLFTATLIGAYHYSQSEKVDLYSGANVGYGSVKIKPHGQVDPSADVPSITGIAYGVTIFGARYLFGRHFGAYAEVGYTTMGYFNVGITAAWDNKKDWWKQYK